MKTKTLLFIGHLWPEPASSAAGYRTMALLEAIANDKTKQGDKHWQVHFACAAEQTEFCAIVDNSVIITHQITLNNSSFDKLINDLQPEMVFYDRFITEEQFSPRVHEQCRTAINILDTQDLHFLRRARQKALHSSEEIDLYSDDSVREIAAILRCDLSIIISTYEMQLLTEQFNIAADILHYCPFMLTTDVTHKQHNNHQDYETRKDFVMIGNFLHPPNWDAVLWCYQSLWPAIRQQLPDAQIHVYGAYPSDKVYQLHKPEQGFVIKGRAQDAIETLGHYRVNLAPLRFGAGIKGKIADGFIAQTPCITTAIGAEGMDYTTDKPWGGLVTETADNEQQLIQDSIALYSNKLLWQQCSAMTHPLIEQLFDQTQHTDSFIKRIHAIYDSISEHRKKNFMGRILRHNLYRSQYYMSKWIEEKNKE